MVNELFAGIVLLYAFIAIPFVVISGMYEAGEDEPEISLISGCRTTVNGQPARLSTTKKNTSKPRYL